MGNNTKNYYTNIQTKNTKKNTKTLRKFEKATTAPKSLPTCPALLKWSLQPSFLLWKTQAIVVITSVQKTLRIFSGFLFRCLAWVVKASENVKHHKSTVTMTGFRSLLAPNLSLWSPSEQRLGPHRKRASAPSIEGTLWSVSSSWRKRPCRTHIL